MPQSQELQNSRTDLLSVQNIDFKSRSIKNAADAVDQQDYVTLSQLTSSIKTAIDETKANKPSTSINETIKGSTPGAVLFVGPNGKLAQDPTKFLYANGVIILQNTANLGALTISKPVKTDVSKNLTTGFIILTTDVSGILPVPNGGSGAATFTANSVLLGNGTGAFQVQAGVTGALTLTLTYGSIALSVSNATIQYKDWAGANQSILVVTAASLVGFSDALVNVTLTTNAFTKGVRST